MNCTGAATVQPLFPEKHTEASHTRQRTRPNLGQRLPTYAQEYNSVTTAPGYIITINTIKPKRTKIYTKPEVSDPDTMYFNQGTKENYATRF